MRRRHSTVKEDITADHHLACQPIEIERGIFAVVKSFSSNSAPIHVQKRTSGPSHQIRCEQDACVRNTEVMHRSGFISFDCAHLQSLQYCPPPLSPQIELREDVLRDIVSSRWFSEERKRACLLKKTAANAEGIPFSVDVVVGSSSSRRYVSIYEANLSYYNKFGRMMVMFDTANNTWHCHCVKAKQACVHKAIAKWHFFQTRKELFTGDESEDTQDSQGSEDKVETVTSSDFQYPPRGQDLGRIVRYIHNKKRLPADLPAKVYGLTSETEVPKHLMPKECVCPECPGDLPVGEPLIISKSAKIITVKGIIEGVTTYGKKCSRCGMMVRYQEWEDGLHNFNDKVILTLHFCLYLRNCLQTHTALGRAIETWELTSGQQYPNKNSLIHGYLHFEALTDHDYNFSCVCCGHHPPVVVMDLHKSCVFSLAVSELEDPPDGFDGEVDIDEFWDSLCLERIARGFVPSDKQNPFAVKPTYHHWAPWIGPYTRKSNKVLNTEHEKVHTTRHPKEQTETDVTEDRLLDEVSNLKVHAIRKLCRECGIDSQGSKMELVLRLREEMKTRSKFDKIFQKVWGASGGWAVVMCPCGQVVSLKFNIRAESPRDFTDLLLSWKHMPNICIYDFARGLAVHANLREPETMPFSPHEGRLLDPSHENLQYASNGGMVNLPWLNTKKTVPDPGGHPLTGSADHYCLYDRFHEGNTKDPKDILRRIKMVPELAGRINSQVAEQLFSTMKKNNYYMNMLSPSAHVFMMRNVIHNYNQRKNKKIKEELKKLNSVPLSQQDLAQTQLLPPPLSQQKRGSAQTQIFHHPLNPKYIIKNCNYIPLLDYVLDSKGDPKEEIVQANNSILTRSDFWTLGLERDVEATIANCCFNIIVKTAIAHGIATATVDAYVVVTWLPPYEASPIAKMICDFASKDVVLLPAWQPGHWTLCGASPQHQSNSCGVFMLMVDMPSIRRWWCGQLLETFTLESPAGLAGTPISPSPHLSHTLQSPSSESPAGLADTPISPSPSPHLSHTFQSRSCPSGTPVTTEDSPFLPPVVLQCIIEETLSMDMAMLGVFNRVSKTFQELAKPFHPSVYINDSLARDLKLKKDSLMHITVRQIYKTAGRGSGLALRLKGFSKRRNWPSARLGLRHMAYGRYLIEDVCLP
ncbi:unnamed protein product [Leuciscus chuanchicus]